MALIRSREELVEKAGELAILYEKEYRGCTPCTFMAIVDALRWGGLEIVPPEMEDTLFPGLYLISAGIGINGDGSCGAVISAAMTVGMALSAARHLPNRNMGFIGDGCYVIQHGIMDEIYRNYRSERCLDIQLRHFGKAWDFHDPEMSEEFLSVTDGCVIAEISRMTVGAIADEILQTAT